MPEVEKYLAHAYAELFPAIEQEDAYVLVYPNAKSSRCAMELGLALFLDKPIILVWPEGVKIPNSLRKIAARIIAPSQLTELLVGELDSGEEE